MKKDFSFVNWLTKRDIKSIINDLDLKLDDQRYDDYGRLINPIRRYTGEDGLKHIMVFCRDAKTKPEEELIRKYVYSNFPVLDDCEYFFYPKVTVLNFTDFELVESFSIKDEEIFMDFHTRLNSVYDRYMNKKFGEFYKHSKKVYVRSIQKQAKFENVDETEENKFEF